MKIRTYIHNSVQYNNAILLITYKNNAITILHQK